MVAKILSAGIVGVMGVGVAVEVDVASRGFPQIKIVGIPVRQGIEMRERLRTAFRNMELPFPRKRVVISVQAPPAAVKTLAVDAAVAVGLLAAQGLVPQKEVESTVFVGGITLDGTLLPVVGSLPIIQFASKQNIERVFLPGGLDIETLQHRKPRCEVFAAHSVLELAETLRGAKKPVKYESTPAAHPHTPDPDLVDMSHIEGQEHAKRALEIAAVGRHSILLTGYPGVGKSLLAQAYKSILPKPTPQEEYEIRCISSVLAPLRSVQGRSFVHVSHSVTPQQLFGIPAKGNPGLAIQAHCGVLFMDELPDFRPRCLSQLKELLDETTRPRSYEQTFASLMPKMYFIAARNPCPCGYLGHPTRRCVCVRNTITHYENRVSGPLKDRLDISVHVGDVQMQSARKKSREVENSQQVRQRVERAYLFQRQRIGSLGLTHNADIPHSQLSTLCKMEFDAEHILRKASRVLGLSLRAYDKVQRVARSIADLDSSEVVQAHHVAEALAYR